MYLVSQEQNNDGPSDVYEDSIKNPVVNGKLPVVAVHSCSLESSTRVELRTQDVQVQSGYQYMDTEHIIMGERLSDADFNHAQKILKAQFPNLNGLRLTLYQDRPSEQATDNMGASYTLSLEGLLDPWNNHQL